MAVEVGEGFGVVGNHGVQVEGLRVGEIRIGHRNWDGGPVGGEPAAEAVGVVASAEVVVAGFGVAFLAFKLVIVLRASVGVGAFAAVWIKIRVVADDDRRSSTRAEPASLLGRRSRRPTPSSNKHG